MADLVKVLIELGDDTWHEFETESLWAEYMKETTFRIMNSPFFAYGLSVGDEVEVSVDDEVPRFSKVVRRSGHSTFRLLNTASLGTSDFIKNAQGLSALGCSLEHASFGFELISVDVRPALHLSDVKRVLLSDVDKDHWSYEDACIQHSS
ncbi:MAG: DUF4265 domain-containing protein [Pseudomonadota bacterium]